VTLNLLWFLYHRTAGIFQSNGYKIWHCLLGRITVLHRCSLLLRTE